MQARFCRMGGPGGWCADASQSPRQSWRTQLVTSRWALWRTLFAASASPPGHAREGRVCYALRRSSATSWAGVHRNDLMRRASFFEAHGWDARRSWGTWVGRRKSWPSARIEAFVTEWRVVIRWSNWRSLTEFT